MKPSKNKAIFSFVVGLICAAIGGIPLFKQEFLSMMPQAFTPTITKYALLFGGLMLLYDGFQIKDPMTGMLKWTTTIAGLFLAAVGAIPLVIQYGLLNKHLPFIATLDIPFVYMQGLLFFFGLYLIYDAFMLFKQP